MTRMRSWKTWIFALAAAAALAVLAVFPAMASSTEKIRLDFDDNYEVGVILEPTVTCKKPSSAEVSVSWNKDVEKWKPGTSVTATVTLSGTDIEDYYIKRNVRIDGATISSVTTTDEGDVVIKASYKPVVQLAAPEEAGWSALDDTKAVWKKSEYATGYEIKLYREDYFVRTIEATGTSKSLKEYMTKEGNYSYEIRAVGKTSEDKQYRESSEYTESSSQPMYDLGDTEGRWRNYSEGKKYELEDGTYAVNGWQQIIGDWYYFNADGYMQTGWQYVGDKWYYMNEDGIMQTGWLKLNDVWYYLKENGDMAVGWAEAAPGKWYYFYTDGSMAANTVVDGRQLDATGLCID